MYHCSIYVYTTKNKTTKLKKNDNTSYNFHLPDVHLIYFHLSILYINKCK